MSKNKPKPYDHHWNLLPELDNLVGQSREIVKMNDPILRDLEDHLDSLPNVPDAFDYEDSFDGDEF